MDVQLTSKFEKYLLNLSAKDQEIIGEFVCHVKQHGFDDLKGRNKFSNNINDNDPQKATKLQMVNKYNLWHYHIGINAKHYGYTESSRGDFTSQFVLPYIKEPTRIILVYMSSHPPFELPSESDLVYP